MISEKQIKDRIKVYENKLKRLRQMANEEVKTDFQLEINEKGGFSFGKHKCSMLNSDGVEFDEFNKFLCDGDILEIKLIKTLDTEEEY